MSNSSHSIADDDLNESAANFLYLMEKPTFDLKRKNWIDISKILFKRAEQSLSEEGNRVRSDHILLMLFMQTKTSEMLSIFERASDTVYNSISF